jgi:hypothetical protein
LVFLDIEVVKTSTENLTNISRNTSKTPTRENASAEKDSVMESANVAIPDNAVSPQVQNMRESSVPKTNIESNILKDNESLKVTELDIQNKNGEKTTIETNTADTRKSYETMNLNEEPEPPKELEKTDSTIAPAIELNKNMKSQIELDSENSKPESLETASISSWMSIDDNIKVKKVKGEQVIKDDKRPISGR